MDDVGERRTDMVAMYYSYDTNSFQVNDNIPRYWIFFQVYTS